MPKAAIVVSSFRISKKSLKKAIARVKNLGYEPVYDKNVCERLLDYGGSISKRVNELHSAFSNPEIEVVFEARGGFGCNHLLDHIDYDLIKEASKPLVGYSDITILHNAFYQKTGNIMLHGPNLLKEFPIDDYSTYYLLKAIRKEKLVYGFSEDDIHVPGKAKGTLVGGNVHLLVRTLGTKYEIDTADKIVFMEALNKKGAWLYDSLWQMKQAGKFDSVKGIILGDFKGCSKYKEYLAEFFRGFSVPVIFNQKFGHSLPNYTMPVGGMCELDTSAGKYVIEMR